MKKKNLQVDEFIIDNMRWSFSRVNSFYTCKRMFFYQYILERKGLGNSFAEFGSFAHHILESYLKGELSIFELSEHYENEYKNNVITSFPPNKYVDLGESYYQKGKEYFDNFEGFDEYEIVGVEKEVNFQIDKYNFVGYIDLLVRNSKGELEIIDHKSKSKFKNKNELKEYLRQLYLYSIPIHQEFGQYPKKLKFNMFKSHEWVNCDFDIKSIDEAKKWVVNTVKLIKREKYFEPTLDDFFCNHLCSHRETCEFLKCKNGSEV